ncbi:MAG: ABC transporter permease [Nocardioides sp.]|uniref:ABC transporter permease n=1 Tax=Nocardioides sp. TaxID=35761 RepID=UPI003F0754D5
MSNGTFTPRPGAAPLRQQVLAQARMESRLMLRNGEQLLVALVVPLMVLAVGLVGVRRLDLDLDGMSGVDLLTPGVLALGVMSTAFTSLAIATGFERRYGVIKRLGASPLPRHGLLLGKVGALLLVQLLQVVVLGGVALALGWTPEVNPLGFLLAMVLGIAAFASLGLFIAGVLRAEATLAVANLVYLVLLAGGAVVIPASYYGGVSHLVTWLPSGALGEAMRASLASGTIDWAALVVLAAWAVLGTVLTTRTFRWE